MRSSRASNPPAHAEAADGGYRADLAYVHDDGFGQFAEAAAKSLLGLLRAQGMRRGLVVDLGCGSGILANALVKAGYGVLGCDISSAMIELAQQRVGAATFRCASVLDAEIPPCVAVAAIGEIFNYLFDSRQSLARLTRLFGRVHAALPPKGLFLFDAALVGRVPGGTRRNYSEAADWACLFEAREDSRNKMLTREITTFRRVGGVYRRDCEVHRLRLYERQELLATLEKVGFRVRTVRSWGDLAFPPGYLGFVAQKR